MIHKNFKDISVSDINKSAISVIALLHMNGFSAYLVGGAVRDLILGRRPKDFDIVTDATNSQIAGLFDRCELIGRRFPIALVYVGEDVIEVSTYVSSDETQTIQAKRIREKGADRIPGTIEEDSLRRDFTINAMYFEPFSKTFIDQEGGLDDLKASKLRFIGDPNQKCVEDPVRIIRGLRQACQLGLEIEEETQKAFQKNCALISKTSMSRLREEFYKILKSGACSKIFPVLIEYEIFKNEFPSLYGYLEDEFTNYSEQKLSLKSVLSKIDDCYQEHGRMREPILYGAFQLPMLYREHPELIDEKTWSFEEAEIFANSFSELWLELGVRRWVKQKIFDITVSYRRLMIQKDGTNTNVHFVSKDYFQDLYRYLRFVNEITSEYQELQTFWDIVRKHPHLAGELVIKYKAGEIIDTTLLSDLRKTNKWQKRKFQSKKKRRR